MIREFLQSVGFNLVSGGNGEIVCQGKCLVAPATSQLDAWSVTEHVFWAGRRRAGFFLVATIGTDVVQVFDLANDLRLLPAVLFHAVGMTPENLAAFGQGVQRRLASGQLYEYPTGLLGWLPAEQMAVTLVMNRPVWFSAQSPEDAIYTVVSGELQRREEIEWAALQMKPRDVLMH